MAREPKSTVFLILAVLVALAVLLQFYVVGYYASGRYVLWPAGSPQDRPKIERSYPELWQMMLYHPASQVESWLRGIRVDATCREGR